MQRKDEVKDLCRNLVQNIYGILGSRDESINSEIARMNSKIEQVLLESSIGARQRQVVMEKIFGETAENISKKLKVKREDIYEQMSNTLSDLYDTDKELETESTDKTRAMLNEQNKASQISIPNMESVLDKAISNTVNYLARIVIPVDVIVEIQGKSKHIKDNALSVIENYVSSSGKSIEQVIDETLETIQKQALKTAEEKSETNPWELSPEQKAAFSEGEQKVLDGFNNGKQIDSNGIFEDKTPQERKEEELRADDIF